MQTRGSFHSIYALHCSYYGTLCRLRHLRALCATHRSVDSHCADDLWKPGVLPLCLGAHISAFRGRIGSSPLWARLCLALFYLQWLCDMPFIDAETFSVRFRTISLVGCGHAHSYLQRGSSDLPVVCRLRMKSRGFWFPNPGFRNLRSSQGSVCVSFSRQYLLSALRCFTSASGW